MTTVLIVEDEAPIAALLAALFTDEGYRVVTARDGQEGLERLAAERPDLVLSDIMMPRLDGIGLCHQMQAEPAYHAIPFIFMSATPRALPADGCRYAAFVAKPFALDQVLDTVTRVLAGPHRAP
jgi:CheY-like chemotaxis protein